MRIYYAGVRFTKETNRALDTFRDANNLLRFPKPAMGFHSTIIYSRSPFYLELCVIPQFTIGIVGQSLELFGNQLVLPYKSAFIETLHKAALKAGATWDHPNYIPHITIAKQLDGFPMNSMMPDQIPLDVLEIYYSEWEHKDD